MRLFKKFMIKKTTPIGVVGISFLNPGIAIAISNFTDASRTLKLIHTEIVTTNSQQEALIELVDRYNLTQYDCYVVLKNDSYRRISIEMPSVNENEIIDAIRWEINDLIDFSVKDALIDFYRAPLAIRANSPQMIEVIACQFSGIKQDIDLCINAKLNIKAIDIQETTIRDLAVKIQENDRGVAILYLLERASSLLIQNNGIIYVARNIDIGYKDLNNPEAYNNIALEIQRSLDYAESHYGIPPITVLSVIKFNDHDYNIIESLKSSLGTTARIVDLSEVTGCNIDNNYHSILSTVIGATLHDEKNAASINLYNGDFVNAKKKSPVNWYLISPLILIAICFVFSLYALFKLNSIESQLAKYNNDIAIEKTTLDDLLAKIPKQDIDANLAEKLELQQNMLDELTQATQLLSQKVANQSSGFSDYFKALSNQASSDIWIKSLFIDDQRRIININGSTFQPERIPYFIKQLHKEPIFSGRSFSGLIVKKSDEESGLMNYEMSTEASHVD